MFGWLHWTHITGTEKQSISWDVFAGKNQEIKRRWPQQKRLTSGREQSSHHLGVCGDRMGQRGALKRPKKPQRISLGKRSKFELTISARISRLWGKMTSGTSQNSLSKKKWIFDRILFILDPVPRRDGPRTLGKRRLKIKKCLKKPLETYPLPYVQ